MASRVLHFGVTTKTNRTRKVAVGTVKKSMAAVCENCKLVAKREDLRMQGSTRSKSGGNQSEKGNKKRAHRGSHHNLTTDRNPCVFRSDGAFCNHRCSSAPRFPAQSGEFNGGSGEYEGRRQ